MIKKLLWLVSFSLLYFPMRAQGDLMSQLDSGQAPETDYAYAAFKSTRVVNAQSLENVAGGVLDFRIHHRFGAINTGISQFYGLDQATLRLGLEYGVTNWLELGIGRSNVEKLVDGFAKVKLLRQSKGKKNMPVTLTYFGSDAITTLPPSYADQYKMVTNRMSFTNQLIVGRKFNDAISVELLPTYVHRNLVPTEQDKNDVTAGGVGARYKFTKSTSLNGEYFYITSGKGVGIHNSASIGFDIETGGHVFQLFITNSSAMVEKAFIAETTNDWMKGGIILGFNISRVFTIRRPGYKGKY